MPTGKWSHAGPCRAFLSEVLSGCGEFIGSDRMRAAIAAYNRIKGENGDEYRRLLEKGRVGVVKRRSGAAAFDNGRAASGVPELEDAPGYGLATGALGIAAAAPQASDAVVDLDACNMLVAKTAATTLMPYVHRSEVPISHIAL